MQSLSNSQVRASPASTATSAPAQPVAASAARDGAREMREAHPDLPRAGDARIAQPRRPPSFRQRRRPTRLRRPAPGCQRRLRRHEIHKTSVAVWRDGSHRHAAGSMPGACCSRADGMDDAAAAPATRSRPMLPLLPVQPSLPDEVQPVEIAPPRSHLRRQRFRPVGAQRYADAPHPARRLDRLAVARCGSHSSRPACRHPRGRDVVGQAE